MKMKLWKRMTLSFALGGVVALVAGAAYHLIAWWMIDSPDHERGMWQGGITIAIVLEGQNIVRKLMNHWTDDGSSEEPNI